MAASASAALSIAFLRTPARAAQFAYKYASNLSIDHPLNVAMRQCWDAVKGETNGRLEVTIFPNNQLGGDTAALTSYARARCNFSPSTVVFSKRLCP